MKNLMNLGKTLNKNEQKEIFGGKIGCQSHSECGPGQCCGYYTSICGPLDNGTGYCDGTLLSLR